MRRQRDRLRPGDAVARRASVAAAAPSDGSLPGSKQLRQRARRRAAAARASSAAAVGAAASRRPRARRAPGGARPSRQLARARSRRERRGRRPPDSAARSPSGRPPASSVSDSSTRASAMPSAIAWCIRDQQRAAVAVALEQVDVPQRACSRSSGATIRSRDELLQRRAVAGRGQREAVEVQVRVEVRVVLPARAAAGQALVDPLAKAREALDDALAEDVAAHAPSPAARRTTARR